MATAVKPLDGAESYLRWKESMLLRLNTAGVAHVLSEDPPAGGEAKKWARDDAVCRGHILAALSDRIFPDYVRHATAKEAWLAVARTYDVDTSRVARRMFQDLEFDERAPLLEQIAHAEALADRANWRADFDDASVAFMLSKKLPMDMATILIAAPGNLSMDMIWRLARNMESRRISREDELQEDAAMAEEQKRRCWSCGKHGHLADEKFDKISHLLYFVLKAHLSFTDMTPQRAFPT
ncbi:hypothetical protein BRADI_3g36070v3 [Brachypodium distachyon]|uniref:CCHC-type domain-containing protein n=1 Tax=Brachypodium distachyon TaxID=15368 RepID=A0A0Q3FJJ7_BRADI|nr:hypothetical protein BRADI_3g36070v3 [Brachypodium distachyon]